MAMFLVHNQKLSPPGANYVGILSTHLAEGDTEPKQRGFAGKGESAVTPGSGTATWHMAPSRHRCCSTQPVALKGGQRTPWHISQIPFGQSGAEFYFPTSFLFTRIVCWCNTQNKAKNMFCNLLDQSYLRVVFPRKEKNSKERMHTHWHGLFQ